MRWSQASRLTVVLLVLLGAVMFTVQNLSRTTTLSFDVVLAAWKLSQPVAIPWLLWGSFGVGFVLATILGWARRRTLARTVARLEQEALLRSAGRPASPSEAPATPPGDDWGR